MDMQEIREVFKVIPEGEYLSTLNELKSDIILAFCAQWQIHPEDLVISEQKTPYCYKTGKQGSLDIIITRDPAKYRKAYDRLARRELERCLEEGERLIDSRRERDNVLINDIRTKYTDIETRALEFGLTKDAFMSEIHDLFDLSSLKNDTEVYAFAIEAVKKLIRLYEHHNHTEIK